MKYLQRSVDFWNLFDRYASGRVAEFNVVLVQVGDFLAAYETGFDETLRAVLSVNAPAWDQ